MPDRVSVTSRRRSRRSPSPSPRQMEVPEVAASAAAPLADANVATSPDSLSDLATAFSEARMLSEQRRLADSVE